MEKKKSTCIIILPSTFRRLKKLAVDMDLPIGTTITYLLDQIAPVSSEELVKMICEDHVG